MGERIFFLSPSKIDKEQRKIDFVVNSDPGFQSRYKIPELFEKNPPYFHQISDYVFFSAASLSFIHLIGPIKGGSLKYLEYSHRLSSSIFYEVKTQMTRYEKNDFNTEYQLFDQNNFQFCKASSISVVLVGNTSIGTFIEKKKEVNEEPIINLAHPSLIRETDPTLVLISDQFKKKEKKENSEYIYEGLAQVLPNSWIIYFTNHISSVAQLFIFHQFSYLVLSKLYENGKKIWNSYPEYLSICCGKLEHHKFMPLSKKITILLKSSKIVNSTKKFEKCKSGEFCKEWNSKGLELVVELWQENIKKTTHRYVVVPDERKLKSNI